MQKLALLYQFILKHASALFFIVLIIFTIDRHHRFEATTNPAVGPFESDVAEYYAYLPHYFCGTPEQVKQNFERNKRTVGMAIMYTPAFLTGHLLAKYKGEKQDGFSPSYQWAVRWGSILICLAGLWFTRKALRKYFDEVVVTITLACIFFGTNLFYYTFGTGEMPHSYLYFLFAVFIYFSLSVLLDNKYKHLLWMGLSGGMIVLIRPTAGLIFLFPLLFQIHSFAAIKDRMLFFTRNRLYLILALLLFIIPLVTQMLIWKHYVGSFVYYSYTKERFYFNDPQIINFLFSFRKGWLVYTPIMAFAVIGIFLSRKWLRDFWWFLVLFMPLNIYILSSWWDWAFGGSYGCRALIESYAILAFPFALFVAKVFSLFPSRPLLKYTLRMALLTVCYLLMWYNIFQTWQYKYLILHWGGMNKEAYKFIFLKERLTRREFFYLHDTLTTRLNPDAMIKGDRDD